MAVVPTFKDAGTYFVTKLTDVKPVKGVAVQLDSFLVTDKSLSIVELIYDADANKALFYRVLSATSARKLSSIALVKNIAVAYYLVYVKQSDTDTAPSVTADVIKIGIELTADPIVDVLASGDTKDYEQTGRITVLANQIALTLGGTTATLTASAQGTLPTGVTLAGIVQNAGDDIDVSDATNSFAMYAGPNIDTKVSVTGPALVISTRW